MACSGTALLYYLHFKIAQYETRNFENNELDYFPYIIQDVSGGIVNILGGCVIDYSE
jgi:hypothetical protein